ncbi:MAG: ADP-forming succinate--CoA ligase subunit beta [Candidatus Eremiobacteraeota bacterium]|nr:ADP-forming succinate--CoA ligase subunit beta [Candidatus Eremiobacteraeota bacterium]
MVIHEYQAKELFRNKGIPAPRGFLAGAPEEAKIAAEKLGVRVVVKAQVHTGGRGKAGGIRLASSPQEAQEVARKIFDLKIKGIPVKKVLVEEALEIRSEYYLGITLDRSNACHVLMASTKGGVDIEQVAKKDPLAILKYPAHPYLGLMDFQIRDLAFGMGLSGEQVSDFISITKKLWQLYTEKDCTLCEINPLIWTETGKWIAGDAKINLDDSALFRHPEIVELAEIAEEDPLERKAKTENLAYVHLGGDIGIIGNGAGLVMTTLDVVQKAGGRPANFLDIGGGANMDVVKKAVELVLSDPDVKGLLINIFGGITRCDEVAKGLLDGLGDISVPVVVRLCGTREKEGHAILSESSLIPVAGMNEAAEKIVSLVREN